MSFYEDGYEFGDKVSFHELPSALSRIHGLESSHDVLMYGSANRPVGMDILTGWSEHNK